MIWISESWNEVDGIRFQHSAEMKVEEYFSESQRERLIKTIIDKEELVARDGSTRYLVSVTDAQCFGDRIKTRLELVKTGQLTKKQLALKSPSTFLLGE